MAVGNENAIRKEIMVIFYFDVIDRRILAITESISDKISSFQNLNTVHPNAFKISVFLASKNFHFGVL